MLAWHWDHLMAFRRYSADDVYYLNLASKNPPWYVGTVDFDLIVFHTLFLTNHWRGPDRFKAMMKKVEPLKSSRAVKVMLPMDEFYFSKLFCEFVNVLGIDCVFSVAPPEEWPHIYSDVDFGRVRFYRVLPGYISEARLPSITGYNAADGERPIDIGYRAAGKDRYWFGRHGMLKGRIAEVFREQARHRGLAVDIATGPEAEIAGDDWYRFLSKCRYTIGVEGGTSLLDPDGSVRQRTEDYLSSHPNAPFEEIERACFPGLDGTAKLYSAGPRHIEACATRTCQILVEGDYSGVLKAGLHYIPVKRDLSNVGEVLDGLADEGKRQAIAERAYQDIVLSGNYTYRRFVEFVTSAALGASEGRRPGILRRLWYACVWFWMTLVDKLELRGLPLAAVPGPCRIARSVKARLARVAKKGSSGFGPA